MLLLPRVRNGTKGMTRFFLLMNEFQYHRNRIRIIETGVGYRLLPDPPRTARPTAPTRYFLFDVRLKYLTVIVTIESEHCRLSRLQIAVSTWTECENRIP